VGILHDNSQGQKREDQMSQGASSYTLCIGGQVYMRFVPLWRMKRDFSSRLVQSALRVRRGRS
jgi:hypothetical protein